MPDETTTQVLAWLIQAHGTDEFGNVLDNPPEGTPLWVQNIWWLMRPPGKRTGEFECVTLSASEEDKYSREISILVCSCEAVNLDCEHTGAIAAWLSARGWSIHHEEALWSVTPPVKEGS